MKNTSPAKVILKQDRHLSVLRRHPWIFSGAIQKLVGSPADGHTVEIISHDGKWLARGSFSSVSQIRVRILSYREDEIIDPGFFSRKIQDALSFRQILGVGASNNACRLVNAESDGLPGLIVDRYGDYLVCQFLSAGAEYWRNAIVLSLQEQWPCKGIFERSDTDSRVKEGLAKKNGTLTGDTPPSPFEIRENSLRFLVDVQKGHKTGFYLDQALNRQRIMKYSEGKEVLNAFSYTGGFGIAAMKAGASRVIHIDSSEDALELARKNVELNEAGSTQVEYIQGDVFNLLRTYRDSRLQFDLVVLDPPKFVSSASQLNTGARGYKDINLLAFKLLKPGGVLMTFSCSGYVKPDLFQKIVADAALDAGRQAYIMEHLAQGPDHTLSLAFPEGLYLKGLVCRVE